MGKKMIVGPDDKRKVATDAQNRLYENSDPVASLFREEHMRYAA
jgi:hypothetical protein